MEYFGLTIDEKHTSEFGLQMTAMYIPLPEPKTNLISVPGTSGSIDLSEIGGQVHYEERSGLSFEFVLLDGDYETFAQTSTEIAMWLHGKKIKVIPDNDLGYYYVCRMEVDLKKSNSVLSILTLTGTAEPFKYDLIASDEDWLWDPFDFETGVIREYMDLVIHDANRSITILGAGKPAVPEFIVTESSNLAVIYMGKSYNMFLPGTYRFPAIRIGEQDVTLQFSGTGRLSIRYRGAYL